MLFVAGLTFLLSAQRALMHDYARAALVLVAACALVAAHFIRERRIKRLREAEQARQPVSNA